VWPVSSGSRAPGNSESSLIWNGTEPSSARSSRPLWGLSVARTRTGLELEGALGTRVEGATLEADEAADAGLRDGQERVQPGAAERHLFSGPLHLHELAGAGHDDVHVDLGGRVLGVVQVQERQALDDTDADSRDAVPDRG